MRACGCASAFVCMRASPRAYGCLPGLLGPSRRHGRNKGLLADGVCGSIVPFRPPPPLTPSSSTAQLLALSARLDKYLMALPEPGVLWGTFWDVYDLSPSDVRFYSFLAWDFPDVLVWKYGDRLVRGPLVLLCAWRFSQKPGFCSFLRHTGAPGLGPSTNTTSTIATVAGRRARLLVDHHRQDFPATLAGLLRRAPSACCALL